MNDVFRRLNILQMLASKKNHKQIPVIIPIKKQMVDNFDIEPLYDFFHILTDNADFVRCYQSRIGFDYEGFNENEIFKIQPLRKFLQNLQEKFPYMFWFSVKRTPEGINVPFLKGYLYSQCRFKSEKDLGDYIMRELEENDLTNFLHSSELGIRELQQKHNLTESEVMSCLIDVVNYLKTNVFRNFQPFENWSRNFN